MTTNTESGLSRSARILVCTGDPEVSREIAEALAAHGHDAKRAASSHFAVDELRRQPVDVCVVDDVCVVELRSALGEAPLTSTQLVRLSPHVTTRGPDGAPDDEDVVSLNNWERHLPPLVTSAAKRARLVTQNRRLQAELESRTMSDFTGASAAMRRLREQVRIASEQDAHVLIRGERGTGTRKVAHALHLGSSRAEGPFIRVNCKILSGDGLKRELFGHENRRAALEAARGGTLFLDEIDSMPLSVQKRMLAASKTGTGNAQVACGLRVLAATHDDLQLLADEGRLVPELLDLFPVAIGLPALREHRRDVPAIAEQFLTQFALSEGRPVPVLRSDALDLLESYEWPGNTAELYNVLERACTLGGECEIGADDIRPWIADGGNRADEPVGLSLREMERKLIETTFARCGGNRELTAKTLRIGLRTLSGKLREYGYPPRGGPGSNIAPDRRRAA